MTSICSKCQRFLGEKCLECGSKALFRRVRPDNRVIAICSGDRNVPCAVKEFPIGESGATHTICEDCAVTMGYPSPKELIARKKRPAGGAA